MKWMDSAILDKKDTTAGNEVVSFFIGDLIIMGNRYFCLTFRIYFISPSVSNNW